MDQLIANEQTIQNRIFTIRGQQVMLDRDLAEMYGVETKVFNQAVKRNIKRFPESFRFQVARDELDFLRSQFVTFKDNLNTKYMPYVFTEQGVSMLSAVLKSDRAIEVSIKIIEAFVAMRRFIASNSLVFERFERVEQRLSQHDDNFEKLFKAIEDKSIKPKQGIFFDGQIFDAYVFVNDLIKSAKTSITLIDNYIDETTLTLFAKVPNVKVMIYTHTINKQLKLDYQKYQKQYGNVTLKSFKSSHDRFLIIDDTEVYHIGASLKDLGKKWFAFSRMELESLSVLDAIGERALKERANRGSVESLQTILDAVPDTEPDQRDRL